MNHTTPLELHQSIYFKREDYNETGSNKDRAIKSQVSEAVQEGADHVVISSSGNAGISLAHYAEANDIKATIFISSHINPEKKIVLQKSSAEFIMKEEPLTESLAYAQKIGAIHLRQSTSQSALKGYHSLAEELIYQVGSDTITHETALFFPVSSGTTLVGTYQGFLNARKTGTISAMPQFHAVQSQYIQPIAKEFDTNYKRKSSSIVDAIVPPLLPPRKNEVVDIIKKTNGFGWVISDDMVIAANEWLLDNGSSLLWAAGSLVQPEELNRSLQTNDVVQQVYRELDLQQQLAAEAIRRGIGERIAVRQDIETARRNVLITALAADIRAEAPSPEEKDVRAVYDADPLRFTIPERYLLDVVQILPGKTNAVAAARSMHNQKQVGDDAFFAIDGEIIATQHKSGWITQPTVAPAIWRELPSMAVGQVMFFEIDTGHFLIRRGPFSPPTQMTYKEAAPLIRQQLQQRNQDEYWKTFIEKHTQLQ